MEKQIVIGVDIGGSHITSAAINLNTLQIISNTTFTNTINSKGSKDEIFKSWSSVINKTINSLSNINAVKIGFAMPGPFHYASGLAMFENNDKYENLYNVSIPNEFPKYLDCTNVELRFLNDATSFGVGVSQIGKAKSSKKVIAITFGTGFGSCFITEGIPKVTSSDVPKDGCLWDKPYKESIADDYFSTRWFVKRYFELSGKQVNGVKEIVEINDNYSKEVFSEFSSNIVEFMTPVIELYKPDLIIFGGNVSNASQYFLPGIEKQIDKKNLKTKFIVSSLMEEAALIGSARLFESNFWEQVKDDLPSL